MLLATCVQVFWLTVATRFHIRLVQSDLGPSVLTKQLHVLYHRSEAHSAGCHATGALYIVLHWLTWHQQTSELQYDNTFT